MQKAAVIAVIDDDEAVREALEGLMRSLGYGVVTFARAEEFLAFDQRRSVGCLIADVQMPGMTGSELQSRLVASGEPIPTILITAYPDHKARTQALQNGVRCYLAKPFREEDLLTCIEAALDTPTGGMA